MGRWRALSLLSVHVLFAIHVAAFVLYGRTVSPVEPSEAMSTLEYGYVNAGFLLLLIGIIATVLFGRFFCGWACHIVALQDLSGWLLTRAGLKPRPIRARLLVWVPASLAAYMFVWPTCKQLVFGKSTFHDFSNALTTTQFWATFPGPWVAATTFVICGAGAVWLLGNKGFCTYVCPYGAIFGLADRFSPTGIVKSDACAGCGHCTAVCTSNVRVHEELKNYGAVIDSGCMKCLDCVSVCPNDALRLDWRLPRVMRGTQAAGRRKTYDWTLAEESVALAIWLGTTVALRGLYDVAPLLLSATLGIAFAFTALYVRKLLVTRDLRAWHLALKANGRLSKVGRVYIVLFCAWMLFLCHSGFVQWHRWRGRAELNEMRVTWHELLARQHVKEDSYRRAAQNARRHFAVARSWGLLDVPEIEVGLAWCAVSAGEIGDAESHLCKAIALQPSSPAYRQMLLDLFIFSGQPRMAIEALEFKINNTAGSAADYLQLAELLIELGEKQVALQQFREVLRRDPTSAVGHAHMGLLLRSLGNLPDAIKHLQTATRLNPSLNWGKELAATLVAAGRRQHAVALIKSMLRDHPTDPDLPELLSHASKYSALGHSR